MHTKDPDLEKRGMAFLERARVVRGLSAQQVARIERRLNAPSAPSQRRFLIPAVAGLALILSGGAALAWVTGTLHRQPVVGPLWAPRTEAPRPSPPSATPSSVAPSAAGPTDQPAQAPSLGPASPEGAADQPAARPSPGPGRAVPHKSSPTIRTPAATRSASVLPSDTAPEPAREPMPTERPENPENPLVAEGKSFAAVLSLWHQAADGPAALAALSAHEHRFPAGQMTLEARLLRAEILLAGHREAEALAILDKVSLGNVPRGRELRTVRGELRVKAGRCADGRADLDAIARGSDALAVRAQNALNYCRP